MGIKLNLEISSPLADDDKALLPAVTMMMMAITNQALGISDEEEGPSPPCGSRNNEGHACVSEVGHSGRHRYRPLNGIAN